MTLFKRTLGPVNQFPVSGSSGGGGSSLTISNNTPGNILMATGEANRIEGVPHLTYASSSAGASLSASTDLYVSGSGNYLYLNGTDENGLLRKIKVAFEGGMLKVSQASHFED
jgi:hypothetical protein